jgi:hypothetical protein
LRRRRERLAQLGVLYGLQRAGDLGREHRGGRDDAGVAPLGGARGRLDGADAKAQLVHSDALVSEALADGLGEELELVRPHARRRAHGQDAALEGQRARAFRDPGADGGAPYAIRDGRARRREAILACAIEHVVDGFGKGECFPTAPHDAFR